MHGPVVSALHDPRKMGQVWPQPATWPGIPYVQGMSGGCCPGMGSTNVHADWRSLIAPIVVGSIMVYFLTRNMK